MVKITIKKEDMKLQEYISPSSINTYMKCPREYYLQYIAKVPIPKNLHLVKGSIVHKCLEDFYKSYKPDLKKWIEDCIQKAKDINKKDVDNLNLPEEELTHFNQDIDRICFEGYWDLNRKINNLIEAKKAEDEQHAWYLLKPKFRELYVKNEELKCCGYIDRVAEDFNKNITIIDYKTSFKYGMGLPDDYKRQLAIYALLYYTSTKEMPTYVGIHFLRYGEFYMLEVTPELLKFAENTIKYVYSMTRSFNMNDYPIATEGFCKLKDDAPCKAEVEVVDEQHNNESRGTSEKI